MPVFSLSGPPSPCFPPTFCRQRQKYLYIDCRRLQCINVVVWEVNRFGLAHLIGMVMMETKQTSHLSAPEFLAEVHAVAQAEQAASERLARTQTECQQIHSEAQAQAVEITTKASERAVEEKNRIISAQRRQTDAKLKKRMEQAGKLANNLTTRRLSDSAIREICERI